MPVVASINAPRSGDPRVCDLSPDKVAKLVDACKTPRVRELEYLQAVFEGNQYVGRAGFWTDGVPLQERAPCIVYKLCAVGIESNVAFAMGEGRFPSILSLSSENDQVFDDQLGVSKDESAVLDSFNAKLVDLARLEQVFRNAYRMAQASRSVAIVLGFRNGLPFADLVWSKLCAPSFDDPSDPYKCTRLEIRYRYTEQWRDPLVTAGKWWTRVFEYLRVVDAQSDTVYQPAEIWDEMDSGVVEGRSPIKSTTKHGFAECPVHWYARGRETLVGTTPDGKAIHDGLCGMLEQIDLALSQRHGAAVYAGDPQTVLTGVSPEEDIGRTGRVAQPSPALAVDMGTDGRPRGQWAGALYYGQQGGTALRRGSREIWRLVDASAKATMLTLDSDAVGALTDDVKDLANKACDGLGVTVVDPTAFSGGGDLSGRTLAFIFSKQINRVSQDREDLGRCCILPVLNLFYRMLLARPDGVYLPGLKKVLPILARFYQGVQGQKQPIWFAPQLKLKWGDYFEPSDVDESTRTATAIAALNGGIVTLKAAVEHVRGVFSIGSVDQFVDALLQEKADRQADAMAVAASGAAPNNPAAQQSPNAAPPASGTPKASRKQPVKKANTQ